MSRVLWVLGTCLLVCAGADARRLTGNEAAASSYAGDQVSEDQVYADGTKAMNEGRWSDAEKAFRRTAEMHGKRADGAIYWQAYVQNKEGQPKQALNTCQSLASEYAQSKWLSECDALLVEMRKTPGIGVEGYSSAPDTKPAKADDEIKMLALNSLMQQDPERALPIVKSILLSSKQSPQLKEKALFVLTESQSKEAQEILNQIARGGMDADLQVRAIHMMAAMKGKAAAGFLTEIYKNAQNDRVKNAAIDGMFISADASDLIAIARAESNPELKRRVVGKLALMRGKEVSDYMMEILNK